MLIIHNCLIGCISCRSNCWDNQSALVNDSLSELSCPWPVKSAIGIGIYIPRCPFARILQFLILWSLWTNTLKSAHMSRTLRVKNGLLGSNTRYLGRPSSVRPMMPVEDRDTRHSRRSRGTRDVLRLYPLQGRLGKLGSLSSWQIKSQIMQNSSKYKRTHQWMIVDTKIENRSNKDMTHW